MVNFKIIACINKAGAIGNDGKLLYRIPSDLKNFARMTRHSGVVIMGRKTFESLPNGKPLKDRVNIVMTGNEDFSVDSKYDNVYIVHSLTDAVELCEAYFDGRDVFVVGGESIYRQFLDEGLVSEMHLTIVNEEDPGDSYFPRFSEEDWYVYYKSMAQTGMRDGVERSFYYEILKKGGV